MIILDLLMSLPVLTTNEWIIFRTLVLEIRSCPSYHPCLVPTQTPYRASLVAQMVKESVCNAGDPGSIPGLGRPPGGGNGNPLQYSCLENSMEPGGLQSLGSQKVGFDRETNIHTILLITSFQNTSGSSSVPFPPPNLLPSSYLSSIPGFLLV